MQHQKRNSKPKPLSEARLRERRRESRELEEVSAFFLPSKANINLDRSKELEKRERKNHQIRTRHRNYQNDLTTQNEPPRLLMLENEETIKYPRPKSRNSRGLTSRDSGPVNLESNCTITEPSKTITYLTWSSSPTSPHGEVLDGAQPSSPAPPSDWTTTPDSIRRALVATGIYRDTGIHPYDDASKGELGYEHAVRRVDHSKNDKASEHDDNSQQQESNGLPGSTLHARALTTDDKQDPTEDHQSQHENVTIPSILEVKYKRGERQTQHDEHSYQKSHSSGRVDYPEDTRKIPLPSDRRPRLERSLRIGCTDKPQTLQNPDPMGQELGVSYESLALSLEDHVSHASHGSREAMPPPPLPLERGHLSAVARTSPEIVSNIEKQLSRDDITGAFFQQPHMDNQQCLPELGTVRTDSASSVRRSGQSRNIGETLCSLETASWIPHAKTPSTAYTERQNGFSRLSMRSPLYQSQLDVNASSRSPRDKSPRVKLQESMTEFITRIERDMQAQLPIENITPTEEDEMYNMIASPSDHDIEPQHHLDPNTIGHRETSSLGVLTNPQAEGTDDGFVQSQGRESHLVHHSRSEVSTPRVFGTTMGVMDYSEDEQLEMSRFWKPNGFAQF